jgi:hypothetical protein
MSPEFERVGLMSKSQRKFGSSGGLFPVGGEEESEEVWRGAASGGSGFALGERRARRDS